MIMLSAAIPALVLAACEAPQDETAQTAAPATETAAAEPDTAGAWPYHAATSPQITEADFAYRIATLSDDRFAGRGPASARGEAAAQWIATEMEAAGLEPAGVDGSWFQPVALIESTL
jgi:predicted outer membrane protein